MNLVNLDSLTKGFGLIGSVGSLCLINTNEVIKDRRCPKGFNVSDLDSVCKVLENRGASFFKRPAEESFGKHTIIEDPEGNLISIAEMKLKDEYTQISYYHGFAPE